MVAAATDATGEEISSLLREELGAKVAKYALASLKAAADNQVAVKDIVRAKLWDNGTVEFSCRDPHRAGGGERQCSGKRG